jgi:hypothetical protein
MRLAWAITSSALRDSDAEMAPGSAPSCSAPSVRVTVSVGTSATAWASNDSTPECGAHASVGPETVCANADDAITAVPRMVAARTGFIVFSQKAM